MTLFNFLSQRKNRRLRKNYRNALPQTPAPDMPHSPLALTGKAVIDDIDHVESHLVALHTPAAFETEQYRMLAQHVEQIHKSQGLRVMAVSSPSMGDGKTTTIINLAGVLSQTPGMRVLLIETDLRCPSVSMLLGLDLPRPRNLVDAVVNPALALKDVVTWCAPFNFALLPGGQPIASHHELLASPRLGELIEEARQQYDCILVDTPPMVPFSDCRIVSRWVDGFFVVVTAHKTPRKELEQALAVLESHKVLGLIFNQDDHVAPSSYYADYYKAKSVCLR